ncbi:hypothetical protein P9578_28290 [Brevibacillus choshinensis]|nr:hypothetical protein [Brevibacillus choshinensis]
MKRRQTSAEMCTELGQAWDDLVMSLCKALHIDKFAEWLVKVMR